MKEARDRKVSVSRGVDLMNAAKGEVKSWVRTAYRQRHGSTWLGEQVRTVVDRLPGYPRWVRAGVLEYHHGYLEAVKEQHVRFLYHYRGEYFSVSGSKDTGYPSWDTLDREVWANNDWSKSGGLFWIYPDQEPAVFYRAAD